MTEIDTGGQLTIDHFRPTSQQGDDNIDNLLYCCIRCNQYKLDYWPRHLGEPVLWNPHDEPRSKHFLELEDGILHPLTSKGAFTLKRLRLNRPPLVAHRLRKLQRAEEMRLLTRYQEIIELLEKMHSQLSELMKEQKKLLKEDKKWLALLLKKQDRY
ncbi:MAG: HNH endonuclease [Pseudomonadota bacterium]